MKVYRIQAQTVKAAPILWHASPTFGASTRGAGADRACAGPERCAQLSSCLLARGCQTRPVPSLFASLTAFATSAPQGETPGDR